MNESKTRIREIDILLEAMNALGINKAFHLNSEKETTLYSKGKARHIVLLWKWLLE